MHGTHQHGRSCHERKQLQEQMQQKDGSFVAGQVICGLRGSL